MFSPRFLFTLLVASALACGDDGATPDTSSSSGDSSGAGAGSGSSSNSSGDASSSSASSSSGSGAGGEGGEGGAPPPSTGVPGRELVNAGTTMTSPNYKMHVTIGQSSPAQGVHTSPNHKIRGGITGTTQ
jgi:hypothetical protein